MRLDWKGEMTCCGRLFHIALEAMVKVVEDTPIMSIEMSVEYRLPTLTKTYPPCSAVSLR